MKNTLFTIFVIAASLLLIPGSASAHHGWAVFELELKVTLKGTVTDFHFVNPHSVVEFKVKDEKGQVQEWEGELTSPSHLVPKGWAATSLEAGDEVTITGYPARNGVHVVRITKVLLSNGRELSRGVAHETSPIRRQVALLIQGISGPGTGFASRPLLKAL